MSNVINYASKYGGELDKMIVQSSKTGFLADNVFKAKFVGSKTVYIPEVDMVGLGNYDRVNGFAKGDVTLTHTPYTLTQERSRQLFIDAQDADESGVSDLAGKLVGEYTRTQIVPEIDAYTISKLFAVANEKGNINEEFTEDNAVKLLLKTINDAEAAMEYDGSTSLVALVDPTLYNALMTSTDLQRHLAVGEFKQGEINMKVKNLNGCSIIPVAAARMKSAYTYADGANAAEGGFTPADDAKNIRAIVMPKDSASLVKKVDKVDLHGLGEDINRDGYTINYRLYYDVFVKNSRKGTVFGLASV